MKWLFTILFLSVAILTSGQINNRRRVAVTPPIPPTGDSIILADVWLQFENNTADSSGNGLDFTGAPGSYSTTTVWQGTYSAKYENTGFFSSRAATFLDDDTVAFVIPVNNPSAETDRARQYWVQVGDETDGFTIEHDGVNNDIEVHKYVSSVDYEYRTGNSDFTKDQWEFVVVQFVDSDVTIYINDVDETTTPGSTVDGVHNTGTMTLGYRSESFLDAIQIYNKRILSSAQRTWLRTHPDNVLREEAPDAPTYTTEYQAVLDAMTTEPSTATKGYQNTMVGSLVSAGYWARMDVLYIFATTSSGADEANINWISPGTHDATEVGAGSLTFTADQGYTGDGTNYLDSYNTATEGTNYTLNDASYAIYIRDDQQENVAVMGAFSGNDYSYLTPEETDGYAYIRINTEGGSLSTNAHTNTQGLWIVTRTASNAMEVYKGGASLVTGSNTSDDLVPIDFRILARPSNTPSTHQVSIAFFMDGISDSEAGELNTIFETYMDALGTGVQ
jgi:hypothetical protein